jgi:uncharacterized protein (TIGR04255 family)
MSSEPLKFPPLREVAFEINFAPHLRVEDRIADFQDEIKGDFPNYSAEITLRLPAALYSTARRPETEPIQPIKTHAFLSLDRQRSVKVSTVNLNLVVQNYLHFDDYLTSATKCLEVALQKFQIREIFRIGLRYINFISIEPQPPRNFRKYVRPVLSAGIEQRGHTFMAEITVPHGDKKLTIRSGLLSPHDDVLTRDYVLDFDCFADRQQTIGPINRILPEFHDIIEKEFHEAVTKEYLEYMRTGRWS